MIKFLKNRKAAMLFSLQNSRIFQGDILQTIMAVNNWQIFHFNNVI